MSRWTLLAATAVLAILAARPVGQSAIPEIAFDSSPDLLRMPADIHLGEVAGVASDSRGRLYVYTRTGNPTVGLGNSRLFSHGGSRLFVFDPRGAYLREIGQGAYALLVAHSVRVDAEDNVWIVDEGSSQIVKFSPEGRVLLILGRKPEAMAIRNPTAAGAGGPAGGRGGGAPGAGGAGDQFTRPSDVAWDPAGNIFVADGHGPNARIAKFDRDGRFLTSWGSRGSDPGQFAQPHSIAVDGQGNVYVADPGNRRIQVFDNLGTLKTTITNIGVPTALCISRGTHPYLYSSHTGDAYGMDDAAIYRLELDGTVVGKLGSAGKQPKELGLVNALDCRVNNTLYVGELSNWRVQKLTMR